MSAWQSAAPLVDGQALGAAQLRRPASQVVEVGRGQLLDLDRAARLVVHDVAALHCHHLMARDLRDGTSSVLGLG